MFESEDFDFDENFLKNVDDTETQYYSQQFENNENLFSTKKPRLEIEHVRTLNTRTLQTDRKQENITNNIEEIFKEHHLPICNLSARNDTQSSTNIRFPSTVMDAFQNSNDGSKENNTNRTDVNLSRRNLIFEILKKGSVNSSKSNSSHNQLKKSEDSPFLKTLADKNNLASNDSLINVECKIRGFESYLSNEKLGGQNESLTANKSLNFAGNVSSNVKQNGSRDTGTNLKRKNVILKAFKASSSLDSSKIPNVNKRAAIISSEKSNTLNVNNFISRKDNSICDSKRSLMTKILEKNVSNNEKHIKMSEESSIAVASAEQITRKLLVRKFPGPAGLLPDIINDTVSPVTYLNCLDENDNDTAKDSDESDVFKYCSQDTRNLFIKGAWQLMLDDLAPNFLKGHEISSIKLRAQVDYYKSDKIPFLAGVIQHIDYSFENPYVILKDSTDIIEGTIHRDVPLKYSNILEPGVVMLLMNVGLLITGTLRKKYHVMIAPQNVVNIYLDKSRIVDKQHMEPVLKNVWSKDQANLIHFKSKSDVAVLPRSNEDRINGEAEKLLRSLSNESNFNLGLEIPKYVPKQSSKSLFESSAFDSDDDATFACLNIEEITNSENQRLACSNLKTSHDLARSSNEEVITNVQTEKCFESDPKTLKSDENFNTEVHAESQNTNAIRTLAENVLKAKIVRKTDQTLEKSELGLSNTKISSISASKNYQLKKISDNSNSLKINYLEETPLRKSIEKGKESDSISKTLDNFEISSINFKNNELKLHDSSGISVQCVADSIINCDYKKQDLQCKEPQFTKPSKVPIRTRLLQFRSNDVLTPPEMNCPNIFLSSTGTASESICSREFKKSMTDNVKAIKTDITESLLCDNENDSGDEILSQLDVDSIISSYNK